MRDDRAVEARAPVERGVVREDGPGADEDGVTLPAAIVACTAVNLSVSLTNTAGVATPRLDAWIDFDGDGTFGDPRDRIATSLALAAGANVLPVNVPCDTPTRATYARFLLTHPWYTLTAPLPEMVSVRRSYGDPVEPKVTMLSPADGYGTARPVIPEPVEQVLFDPGATGTILTALVGVLGWAAVRRRWADRRWAVPLATVAISLASLVVGWHGATPELPRLAIVSAIALRIGLIVLAGFLAEAELGHRRSRRAEAPPVPAAAVGP